MILPRKGDPVVVQNMPGRYGRLHTRLMLDYGTNVAAGAAPGKGGQSVEGVPVYDTVAEAVAKTGAKASICFVPAEYTLAAGKEALDAGIKLLVIITEHVPVRDELRLVQLAQGKGASIIGPNCPGIIIPSQKAKLGIMPAPSFSPGNVALYSRSGTLTYEIAGQLTAAGYGQSLAVGIGGDPVNGTTSIEWMDHVQGMDDTEAVVIVGEIGGDAEERLARHIQKSGYKKPIVGYIAGRHAPKEKKMGHAGAIIYGDYGTADSKIRALTAAGVKVAKTPMEVPGLVSQALG
ncbi:MAG: succinate--CoA ligase subunit alpha [Nitrososphaerota archaeon]|jgi:succinyl-CoA synthetase alpha subunit|nr:succinate--CoA ligase subunit alpha [Nitrososphaerota archaeon]MDG6938750.1 succinate--CoA ligase subunit alpha [Nitrososphaerota archaeon]MDG6956277.1 succinate--CoA ligase subunit alpha [Nitrososphaerota archaeon]MDG6959425.1 succinate--CoA ligase subunit alpha [Nitrososphaerota archaeon]MDG7014812.1 succinate--CoA ligase subunit alpha [Nitrososphaerota archaeon]